METFIEDVDENKDESEVKEDEPEKESEIQVNGTNDMICAKCFNNGNEAGAVGICKDCKYYLCSDCVESHRKDKLTQKHTVVFFYCATKLRVNKLVRANFFCLDCGQYLCKKCHLDHTGFRIYRRHTFIGGKTENDDLFDHVHEEPCSRRHRLRPSSVATSRLTFRRSSSISSRSQTIAGSIKRKEPKQSPTKSPYLDNRKLIYSTTGTLNSQRKGIIKPPGTTSSDNSRAKSVHYETESKKIDVVGEFDLRASKDKQPCQIISSIFLDNDKFVVADQGNCNLKLFDEDFKLDGQIDFESNKIGLCNSKICSTELYAFAGNLVFKISAADQFSILETIETEVKKIEGIASWESGIAIIFKDARSPRDERGHFEIHLLDFDGNVKYQMTLGSQFSVKLMTPIWYTTSIDNGKQMLLADTFNNRILCVDLLNWQINYVIKGKVKGGLPRSICQDLDENIFVVWYDEIHKLSKTGKCLGIPIKDIDRKAVIAYNRKSQCLVVNSWSKENVDRFRVYQM